MSSSRILSVTDATFNTHVLEADRPVLVKFEARWCWRCMSMGPMLGELAAEFSDRLTIATLDIDQNKRTAHRLRVRGIPTMMIFDQGQLVAQRMGLPRKSELAALILQRLPLLDDTCVAGRGP